MRRRGAVALAVSLIVAIWYANLFVASAHVRQAHPANERVERVERYGNEVERSADTVEAPGNSIVLRSTDRQPSSAVWTFNHYELGHDLARATGCNLTFYAIGLEARSATTRAQLRIFLNDTPIRTVRFSSRRAADFPFTPMTLVPDNVAIGAIELAPLDRAYAIETGLDPSFCGASRWTIRIEAIRATWTISHVGLIARFSPERKPFLGRSEVDALAGVLEIAALLTCLYLIFAAVLVRLGAAMLAVAALVTIVAPLTHDQWDFAIWLRFVDLAAFGHGNPAAMWSGTPLWAFLPALFAPALAATNAYFGDGSQDLTVIALKGTMALAALYNGLAVAAFAPARLRRLMFTIVIASPIALYQLGAGYREVFAAAFALAGFHLATRARLFVATLAFAAAASVSESLLPLVLFPAALALIAPGERRRGIVRSAAYAATGIASIAFQWLTLVPTDLAKTAISSRVVSYRYGGGSWYAGLDSFGLLPPWVGSHSFLVVGIVFGLLAGWPAWNAGAAIIRRSPQANNILLRSFTCFVVAFFLSYRGVDPSTWYALFVVTAAYFARVDPTNPFPLLLGTVQGAAFYAIVGLGDFVNWTFLWPRDAGLLGILGRPVDALVLTSNALTAVLYFMLAGGAGPRAFSKRSTWFVVTFFGAVANASIELYASDAVFCSAACAIALATIALMLRARKRSCAGPAGFDAVTAFGFVTCVVCGAAFSSANPAASLVGSIAVLLAFGGGFGMVDIVLVAGACLLLFVERGFGYYSIAGWSILAIVAAFAIAQAARRGRISSSAVAASSQ